MLLPFYGRSAPGAADGSRVEYARFPGFVDVFFCQITFFAGWLIPNQRLPGNFHR